MAEGNYTKEEMKEIKRQRSFARWQKRQENWDAKMDEKIARRASKNRKNIAKTDYGTEVLNRDTETVKTQTVKAKAKAEIVEAKSQTKQTQIRAKGEIAEAKSHAKQTQIKESEKTRKERGKETRNTIKRRDAGAQQRSDYRTARAQGKLDRQKILNELEVGRLKQRLAKEIDKANQNAEVLVDNSQPNEKPNLAENVETIYENPIQKVFNEEEFSTFIDNMNSVIDNNKEVLNQYDTFEEGLYAIVNSDSPDKEVANEVAMDFLKLTDALNSDELSKKDKNTILYNLSKSDSAYGFGIDEMIEQYEEEQQQTATTDNLKNMSLVDQVNQPLYQILLAYALAHIDNKEKTQYAKIDDDFDRAM